MSWQLDRSEIAENDLLDIWLTIALDNPSAADRQLDKIEATFQRLTDQPHLGRARDDISSGLRGIVAGRYVILYALDEAAGRVQIIRVLHGMRDLVRLFE
jgi:toxin ParE1/3/4